MSDRDVDEAQVLPVTTGEKFPAFVRSARPMLRADVDLRLIYRWQVRAGGGERNKRDAFTSK